MTIFSIIRAFDIIRFVTLVQTDRFTVTDLCEQFAISRKTAYKHLDRYAPHGVKGLQARSTIGEILPSEPPLSRNSFCISENLWFNCVFSDDRGIVSDCCRIVVAK